jgi:hypothetical protein
MEADRGEEINWPMLFLLSIAFDLSDFLGGMAPVIGDLFDLIEAGIFYLVSKSSVAFATLVELVPMLDLLPSYTLAAAYLYFRREKS